MVIAVFATVLFLKIRLLYLIQHECNLHQNYIRLCKKDLR